MTKISVTNTKGVIAAFNKYGDEAVKEIKSITQITAQEVEDKAKNLAPVDKGQLRQGIVTVADTQDKGFTWRVLATQPYSAYHEFGTGTYVNIKEGWGEMARLFKGKGVKQVNILPEPFMYPAFVFGRRIFAKNIKESLNSLSKKFNNG